MAAAPPPPAFAPASVLRGYFHAKDENRPHRLDGVFAADARLEIVNRSGNIAFPAATLGRAAIADVLVRAFARSYENVYSFYLAQPGAAARTFACGWLVAMSEKEGGRVRIGCGRYDWTFDPGQGGLASGLRITIEAMELLPPDRLGATLAWVAQLDYPWSSARQVLFLLPPEATLQPVRSALERLERDFR
jgi:hypothetical protein